MQARYIHYHRTAEAADRDAELSIPDFGPLDAAHIDVPGRGAVFSAWIGRNVYEVGFTHGPTALIYFEPGRAITLFALPVVVRDSQDLRYGEVGYADALAELVGQDLTATDDYIDDGPVLNFGQHEIRLDPNEFASWNTPELVLYGGMPRLMLGDAPWEHQARR